MIKFFRKIRQKLLNQNRFSKYLVYAIGEIVLVVIGILIALQINNWNEEKKEVQKEVQLLKELKASIVKDTFGLWSYESIVDVSEKSLKRIIKEFEEKTYSDSLNFFFGGVFIKNEWTGTYATYETLKSEGLSIISNDTLRKEIIDLYEGAYPYIKESEKNSFMDYNFFLNHSITLFDNIAFSDKVSKKGFEIQLIQPHSIIEVRKDKLFNSQIKTRLSEIEFLKYFVLNVTKTKHKKIIHQIEKELKKLEQ